MNLPPAVGHLQRHLARVQRGWTVEAEILEGHRSGRLRARCRLTRRWSGYGQRLDHSLGSVRDPVRRTGNEARQHILAGLQVGGNLGSPGRVDAANAAGGRHELKYRFRIGTGECTESLFRGGIGVELEKLKVMHFLASVSQLQRHQATGNRCRTGKAVVLGIKGNHIARGGRTARRA